MELLCDFRNYDVEARALVAEERAPGSSSP
jgi:hypothetical protein